MHLFVAVAVIVVGVAALPRVAEPRVEVTVVEGAADGGENADPNAGAVEEAVERVEKIQEAGVKSKTDLVGLYSKLGSAVTRLENIYEVKSVS